MARIWNHCTLLVECKVVQPLWKPIWQLLKTLIIELPYDPAIPLASIYIQNNCKQDLEEIFVHPRSLQYYTQ